MQEKTSVVVCHTIAIRWLGNPIGRRWGQIRLFFHQLPLRIDKEWKEKKERVSFNWHYLPSVECAICFSTWIASRDFLHQCISSLCLSEKVESQFDNFSSRFWRYKYVNKWMPSNRNTVRLLSFHRSTSHLRRGNSHHGIDHSIFAFSSISC